MWTGDHAGHAVRDDVLGGFDVRVLLLDEDADRRERVVGWLSAEGCRVAVASSAPPDLVARVRDTQAEVVVCTAARPDPVLFAGLRQLDRDEPRPTVLFVDAFEPGQVEAALAAGVDSYVVQGLSARRVKPVLDVAVARFAVARALHHDLRRARAKLAERRLVEVAVRALVGTRGLTEPAALAALRATASGTGRSLGDVAETIAALEQTLAVGATDYTD